MTKSYSKIAYLLIIITSIIGCSNPENSDPDNSKWKLVWQDEFNGSGEIDMIKWDKPEYNRRNNDNGPDGWWLKENSYKDGNGNQSCRGCVGS